MARRWAPRELRLVGEYLSERYPDAHTYQRVRVGSLHPELHPELLTEAERRLVGVFRRWADAIVVTGSELIVVEASIYPDLGDISKVKAYARLVPHTEELQQFRDLPVVCQCVYCVHDRFFVQLCREEQIEPVLYRPAWAQEYIETLAPSKQQGSKTYPLE